MKIYKIILQNKFKLNELENNIKLLLFSDKLH